MNWPIIPLMFIMAACACAAQVEERHDAGECPDGGAWLSTTIIEQGRVLLVYGVDCAGRDYAKVVCPDAAESHPDSTDPATLVPATGGDAAHEESDPHD